MKLLEHQRFRAGYDFLLLRCESGELDASVGQWWTDFIEGDAAARESLLSQGGKDRAPVKKRRRRSSNAKGRRPGDGMEGGASTVEEGSARDNREERDVRDVRDVRYGDESGGQRDD